MVCVLKESSTPSFIVECGRFGTNKIGNQPKLPMHGGAWAREAAVGLWPHLGCAHALVGPPRDRLCVVGSWVGLDPSPGGARPRLLREGGLLHFSCCAFLLYAFYFAPFAWFSTCIQMCVLQNMFSPIQVELCQ